MYNVLITCPPMIKRIKNYTQMLKDNNIDFYCPDFVQTLSEEELIKLLPNYDGWIIGDDPATRRVFEAGIKGKLRVAVKWGVGVDNVDFEACKDLLRLVICLIFLDNFIISIKKLKWVIGLNRLEIL